MSHDETRTAILAALELPITPVIALHGRWGTGKTHLWLYISCMSYSSIDAIKSAVFGAILSHHSKGSRYASGAFKALVALANSKLPEGFKINPSLSDIQAFLPPIKKMLPANPIIALDDIERVAAHVSIHELLGFVSFLATEIGARVLLILNRDELKDRLLAWEELRDKVISTEIALKISTDECISIGLGEMPSEHLAIFKDCIRRIEITNIRTIQHVRRMYDTLGAPRLVPAERWPLLIPSIALLTSIHKRAIPSMEMKDVVHSSEILYRSDKDIPPEKVEVKRILSQFNLGSVDDFELRVLIPFLQDGHLNKKALIDYMSLVDRRQRSMDADALLRAAWQRHQWDASDAGSSVLSMLRQLVDSVDVIDQRAATLMADMATEKGEHALSASIVDSWIGKNEASIRDAAKTQSRILFLFLDGVHPRIRAAFERMRADAFPMPTLREAIKALGSDDWSGPAIELVKGTTSEQFEAIMRTPDPSLLEEIFNIYKKLMIDPSRDNGFSESSLNFLKACRAVVTQDADSRLAEIIFREFAKLRLTERLKPLA